MAASTLSWRSVSPVYWLRPAEWVVVLFTGYLLIRVALAGTTIELDDAPRVDMFSALMLAVLAGQVVRYRSLPWPEESEFVQKHWLLFPLTLAPLVADVVAVAQQPDWGITNQEGGYLIEVVFLIHWLIRRFAFAGLPLVLLWLALGTHIKVNDGIQGKKFAGEIARGLGSAIRDWAPPVMLTFAYSMLGSVLDHTGIPDQDVRLAAMDRFFFFGHNPVAELQKIASRPVSEWMAFCYGFYAPIYPLCFGLLFAQKDRRGFYELALAVTLGLAIGYLGYTVVPAMGPAFTQKFDVSLDDYYFKWFKDELMDRYRVPRDCFPSLHTCISFTFLWSARRYLRPLFWFLLPIVVTIPVSCLYLRYHYFSDLVAGAALFMAVAWISPRLQKRREQAWSSPPPSPTA